MEKQRLDRFLSNQLNISRNTVRTGIKNKMAQVNGTTVNDCTVSINVNYDVVEYCGKRVAYKKFIYLVMNKPSGIITASNDKSRQTVLDLVPESLRRKGLAPVGRLDKDTTGLLILTDNGDFAHKCISPKSNIEKVYLAELDGEINQDIIYEFANGVVLADGYKCKPAKLQKIDKVNVRITVTEGKYHQIKRMFGAVGLGVNKLHREAVGGLSIPSNLKAGECAEMTESDLNGCFADILSVLDKRPL